MRPIARDRVRDSSSVRVYPTQAELDAELIATLSLPAKVLLLTGADSWRTHCARALGLRPMIMSDGPSGARGVVLDERQPSTCLPCSAALGATWDQGLVHQLAFALGREAASKGISVLLGPQINLMRTPAGGRGFECFAEDPVLTARLAVSYVRGVQQAGVGATAKHYVGNDSETQRRSYDGRISEQVLRELYLAPFEACVKEAGVALVMAAYNQVNGTPMTEHGRLLADVLKCEWGFDGVVISDWHAARSTTATALATLDLSMPGPDGPWGQYLADAVAAGLVTEAVLDDNLLRRATAAAFVLLSNAGQVLPLNQSQVGRLAVIGPNALRPTIQGSGAVVVAPVSVSTPAAALTARLGDRVEVAEGCQTGTLVPAPAGGTLTDPVTGEPGLHLEFLAADGTMLRAERRTATAFAWWDHLPPGIGWGESGTLRLTTTYTPQASGPHLVGAAGIGRLNITVDGELVADRTTEVPADAVLAMTNPGQVRAGG